jgi:hypothetical protein
LLPPSKFPPPPQFRFAPLRHALAPAPAPPSHLNMDDFYRGLASSDDPKKRGIVERYAAAARIGSGFSAAPRARKMVDVAKLERCCLC